MCKGFAKRSPHKWINLCAHSPNAHLTAGALEVRSLNEVADFVQGAGWLEINLYLNSVLYQVGTNAQNVTQDLLPQPKSSRELGLLTYNIWGLPNILRQGAKDKWRFSKIASSLVDRAFDIVTLQEVWCREAQVVIEASAFPFRATDSKLATLFGNSGLATLSRYPIVHSELLRFRQRCGLESLVAKGALYTRIALSAVDHVDVYNVHLISEPERLNRIFLSAGTADDIRAGELE